MQATYPVGVITTDQRAFFNSTRRRIIESTRDNIGHINKALSVYDASFADLVARQAPKTFRDFLLGAPHMFVELGEKIGAISHIVAFWRHRFSAGKPNVNAEEFAIILRDFSSGFGEKIKVAASVIPQPALIDMTIVGKRA